MSPPTDPSQEIADKLDLIEGWASDLHNGATCMRAWQIEKLARYIADASRRARALLDQIEGTENAP